MSDGVHSLLVRGIAAAKANDRDEARFYLEMVLREPDSTGDQKADAWLWLSQITDDPVKRRECLEYVIAFEPSNAAARRGLAILDGRLKPEDVIDPRQTVEPIQPSATPAPENVRRYVCPKCAGKMAFEADQRRLACRYCGHRLWEYQAIQAGALVSEQDFAAMLPTAKASRWALPTRRTLSCQGCGATFTLPPAHVTGACPFCGSAHIVTAAESRDLIQPEAVLPFRFDARAVVEHAHAWLEQQRFRPGDLDERAKVTTPHGIYLPFWTFDISGEVTWRALVAEQRGKYTQWVPRTGSYLALEDDLIIPASHSLPLDLLRDVSDFDTQTLAPYTAAALADWSAEIYQIPMANASLVARQRTLEVAKEHVRNRSLGSETVRDLTFNTAGLTVETYKLVLLPIWVSSFQYKSETYTLVINDQTGHVAGDVPRSGFQKLMASIFGDD